MIFDFVLLCQNSHVGHLANVYLTFWNNAKHNMFSMVHRSPKCFEIFKMCLIWWSSATKVSGHQNRMFLYVSIVLSFPSKGWRIPLLMLFYSLLALTGFFSSQGDRYLTILLYLAVFPYCMYPLYVVVKSQSITLAHFFLPSFSGLHTHTTIYFHFNSSYLPVMFSEQYGRNTEFPLNKKHTCHIFIRI